MKKSIKNRRIKSITIIVICFFIGFFSILYINKRDTKNNNKYEKLEEIPLNYTIDEAINDNCYVITSMRELYNVEVIQNFVKCIQEEKNDDIRVVQITIEGDLIITDISYNNNTFNLRVDNTRDMFLNTENRIIQEYVTDKYEYIELDEGDFILIGDNEYNVQIPIVF